MKPFFGGLTTLTIRTPMWTVFDTSSLTRVRRSLRCSMPGTHNAGLWQVTMKINGVTQ